MNENFEEFIDSNIRFTMNLDDIQFGTEKGKMVSENLNEFLKKRKLDNITVFVKLKVGDIVKLKRTGKIVVVDCVNYNDRNIIKADYAGYLYNNSSTDLILFGQDDIEKKYSINIEEAQQMRTR